MNAYLNEAIGWMGAGAFIIAYFLLSLKILSAQKIPYHLINATGGIFMAISTYHMHDRPAFIVNIIWMGIAVFSIARIFIIGLPKS